MTQRRNEEGVPPPGHIIDDTGRVRRVLGTLPLTADGCVAGIGAKVINPMGEEWVACVRSYAHEPGAEDDDPNCLLADCRAPLDDPPRRAPPMTPHDRAAEGEGRRPWFSVYRGEDPSWQVVKHLAPDTRARIFGVLLGRLWIGLMWRTNEPAITEAECRAIDAFRRDRQ